MRRNGPLLEFLKWSGTVAGITGTALAALDYWPLAPLVLIGNCAIWLMVGKMWREPTVVITNVVAGGIALVALIFEAARRSF